MDEMKSKQEQCKNLKKRKDKQASENGPNGLPEKASQR